MIGSSKRVCFQAGGIVPTCETQAGELTRLRAALNEALEHWNDQINATVTAQGVIARLRFELDTLKRRTYSP